MAAEDRNLIALEDELEAVSAAHVARGALGQAEGSLHHLETMVEDLGLLVFSIDLGSGVGDGAYVRVGDVGGV